MGEPYYEILLSGPAGREQTIRAALMNAGVGKDDFVPCHHGWEHLEEERAKGWVAYRADDLEAAEIACSKAKGWRLRIHRHAIGLAIQEQIPGPRIDPLEQIRSRMDGLERMVAGLVADNARLRGEPPPIAGGALESPPWVIKADQHSADLFRQMPQSLLGGTGVVGSGDLLVTANSPAALNVLCAAGQVWIPGTIGGTTGFGANAGVQSSVGNTNGGTSTSTGYPTSFTIQGSYYAYQDAQVTLSIASADPSHPRIDLVCASVQDAEWAGSANQCVLQVITGTAGASPAPTAPPANSVVASSVWVPAAASTITSGDLNDLRPIAKTGTGFAPTIITATGSITIPPNASHMLVKMQGGGGGGAGGNVGAGTTINAGGGGGGGQYVEQVVSLSGVSGLTATIGAGGAGGAANNNGGDGGNTTLSGTGLATITATGGGGGWQTSNQWVSGYGGASGGAYGGRGSTYPSAANAAWGSGGQAAPGAGGTGTAYYTTGGIGIPCQPRGGAGIGFGGAGGGGGGSNEFSSSSTGGAAVVGGGGAGFSGAAGGNATGYGNGGGGGAATSVPASYAGGNGSAGLIIIAWMA